MAEEKGNAENHMSVAFLCLHIAYIYLYMGNLCHRGYLKVWCHKIIMEERLSQEDIELLQKGISFHHQYGERIFCAGIIFSIVSSAVIYALGARFIDSILILIWLILLTALMKYYAFERSKKQLEQDLQKGIKMLQTATIKKIKKGKEGKVYIMNNGLEVTDLDLDEDHIRRNNIVIGQQMILSLTPYHRMILKIKEIK